jgi:uncharacterized protein
VNSSRYPLRINVGFLLNQNVGTSRDIHFDFPQINLSHDLELSEFVGLVRISRTPQGLLVQCSFSGKMDSECVRCLTNFKLSLSTQFSELYAFKTRSMSESGLIVPEDGNIDLAPLAREYILVEVPISPLCREDCKGLCVICGEDLNQGTCEHQQGISGFSN